MVEDRYTFFQGWSKYSRGMEKFLEENLIPYTLVHQEIGEKGIIFAPQDIGVWEEREFEGLKKLILNRKDLIV